MKQFLQVHHLATRRIIRPLLITIFVLAGAQVPTSAQVKEYDFWRMPPRWVKGDTLKMEIEKLNWQTNMLQGRLSLLRDAARDSQKQLDENNHLQQVLTEEFAKIGATPEFIDSALSELNRQLLELEMELAGKEALRTALEEAVAATQKVAAERAAKDEIALLLEEVKENRAKALERVEFLLENDPGVVNRSELQLKVENLQLELKEAKIRSLERREDLQSRTNGQLRELITRLSDTNIEIDVALVQVEFIKNKLAQLQVARQRTQQYRELQSQLDRAHDRVGNHEATIDEVRFEIDQNALLKSALENALQQMEEAVKKREEQKKQERSTKN